MRIDRRGFLTLVPTCAVAWTMAPTRACSRTEPDERPLQVALGFCPDATPSDAIVDITRSRASGDRRMVRDGATLTFSGAPGSPAAFDLLRCLIDWRPFHDIEVDAWSVDTRDVLDTSSSVTQRVPVSDEGIALIIELEQAGVTYRSRCVLSPNHGQRPLREGTYVVAPDTVDWTRWRVTAEEGVTALVDRDANPAAFSHLLIHVKLDTTHRVEAEA